MDTETNCINAEIDERLRMGDYDSPEIQSELRKGKEMIMEESKENI